MLVDGQVGAAGNAEYDLHALFDQGGEQQLGASRADLGLETGACRLVRSMVAAVVTLSSAQSAP